MVTEKRKKVICLVHFNPLELFPPAMNMANYFESKMDNGIVKIFTTNAQKAPFVFVSNGGSLSITRLGWTGQSLSFLKRLITYLWFNLGVLSWMIIRRPSAVLYCETISAFAPVFYKKYINKGVKLMIHYHEYMTPEEYKRGMVLVRKLNVFEKRVYNQAAWLSHTNGKRLKLFKEDLGEGYNFIGQILPNFPPQSWTVNEVNMPVQFASNRPLRIVYLGNLNLQKLYIKEFSNWVVKQKGAVIWDIYSLNNTSDTDAFFDKLNSSFINFKGAAAYFDLPLILKKYDVGVILYKGLSLNWIYSVPNKLFEYHVCGLDVWISSEIVSALDYAKVDSLPLIQSIDYQNMPSVEVIYGKKMNDFKIFPFQAELVLEPLWEAMIC